MNDKYLDLVLNEKNLLTLDLKMFKESFDMGLKKSKIDVYKNLKSNIHDLQSKSAWVQYKMDKLSKIVGLK